MKPSPLGRKHSRKAGSPGLSLFLGLVLLAGALPLVSRAQLQTAAAPDPGRKHPGAEFVPGEILVRYRTDEVARSSESEPAPSLPVGRARKIPYAVERFEGSELVRGLRLVRVR
ncbi:MAG TPA: hypothetical protein VD861_13985, partial [Pyrinomonadaceae bacterium]|nr:hypothetical protein [Pyrinomonadaceae bacterium]